MQVAISARDVLIKLRDKHEIIELLLRYRKILKLLTSYVRPLIGFCSIITDDDYNSNNNNKQEETTDNNNIEKNSNNNNDNNNGKNAYVYPQWNQLSTATGRLSTSNPSFQNLPRDAVTIDRETIVNIRKCFICRNESAVLVRFDYSQFEMRILASHVGKHSNLYQLFDGGINSDIYRTCASKILKKHYNDVTVHERKLIKSIVLGIIYSEGPKSISESLGIDEKEAKRFINLFFSIYKKTKQFINNVKAVAMSKGYVEGVCGRKRPLPGFESRHADERRRAERQAVNSLIQGASSTLLKIGMLQCDDYINNECYSKIELKPRLIGSIHDEVIFEIHRSKDSFTKNIMRLKSILESVGDRVFQDIPSNKFPVNIEIGFNLGEMKDYNDEKMRY